MELGDQIEKIIQLQSQAQHSSDFLVTRVQHLTESFSKINQKTSKHAITMSNAQKCIDYMDTLLECLKTAQKEEKLITRGVGTDVQPFLESLNRIQASIKILQDNPWKGSEKSIISLKQLRKVGLLQLNNLFVSKLRQVSEPLDVATLIRNGVEDAVIIEDESMEFIQKLAATINDGSMEASEFTKEFKDLRAKFIYESLLPLGTDAFQKRGSIDVKSPVSSGYIEQFSSLMEWAAILFSQERKFHDSVFRIGDIVHKTYKDSTSDAFDMVISCIELSIRDLKDMRKSKAIAGFLNFLQSINSIRSDFRMIINSFEGIAEKQMVLIQQEEVFLGTNSLFFDLKINEQPHKPQHDATIHENVHSAITFIRKLVEHDQNLQEWIELFAKHHSSAEYMSWMLMECSKVIQDTQKHFQHDLHRQVYCLNNYNFTINVIKENTMLTDLVDSTTNKVLTTYFHTHFDAYMYCWSSVANSIEETRKTLEEKAFKDKCKQIYSSLDDIVKLHKPVLLIDEQLRKIIKSTLKDKLMTEYDLMTNR